MFALIQKRYGFTDYQIAQLKYTFTILFSESSKFVMIALFYRNCFSVYLYAAILLSILRLSTGGLHVKTYWGCFAASFAFFYASIRVLPQLSIPKTVMYAFLIGCMIAVYQIGPVASIFRTQPEGSTKKRLVAQSLIIIFIHLVLYCTFDSIYFAVGSWIIILQTLQLIAAKFIVRRR